MKKITIIDYGCGNILNLIRAIEFLNYKTEITNNSKKILNSSHVILPGVGAFGNAINKLKENNLNQAILKYADSNKPLLGICLGMQILFKKSYEFGLYNGLGLIDGEVIKISNKINKKIKIPHVGWNEINPCNGEKKWESKILKNDLIGKSFYFVHSFIGKTKDPNLTIADSNYLNVSIPAVVASKNIFGCQFHPEKSGKNGLKILKNFCEIQ
jgi:imidazole glycerol-phosphate synthase subunit HisH